MTDLPPDTPTPESEHEPPEGKRDSTDHGPTFLEWLGEKGITETGENKPQPAPDSQSEQTNPLPPDIRAILWTIPLGLLWLTGSYIVPNFATHGPHTMPRLIGVALIAWAIALGCELSCAYALRTAYPALGMWEWLTHPRIVGAFTRSTKTAGKAANSGGVVTLLAACALPGLFVAFYVFSALLAIAIQLWVALITIATLAHVAVTVARHQRKGQQ